MLTRKIVRALAGSTLTAVALLGAAGCGGLGPGDYVKYRIASEDTELSSTCYEYGLIPADIKEDTTTLRSGSTILLYIVSDEEAVLDNLDDEDQVLNVLDGTIEDDTYSFSGKSTDVDYSGGGLTVDADHDGLDDLGNDVNGVDADHDGLSDYENDADGVDVDSDGLDDRFINGPSEDDFVDVDNDGVDDRIVELPSDTKVTLTSTAEVEMTVDGETVTGKLRETHSWKCEGVSCSSPETKIPCVVTSDFKGVEIEETDPAFRNDNDNNGSNGSP